ncbi:hypothetical protein L6452_30469 [Arctium lappa]|uniref:Uncharacterized protein n=1 Tax=Arctium lappa TaxID=4217 RepID=A0ACB8ZIG4_ARCLA|nr:hypothetical protein L6452_30469 [Arctium lappa]
MNDHQDPNHVSSGHKPNRFWERGRKSQKVISIEIPTVSIHPSSFFKIPIIFIKILKNVCSILRCKDMTGGFLGSAIPEIDSNELKAEILKSCDLVDVKQDEAYSGITMDVTFKLLKQQF